MPKKLSDTDKNEVIEIINDAVSEVISDHAVLAEFSDRPLLRNVDDAIEHLVGRLIELCEKGPHEEG